MIDPFIASARQESIDSHALHVRHNQIHQLPGPSGRRIREQRLAHAVAPDLQNCRQRLDQAILEPGASGQPRTALDGLEQGGQCRQACASNQSRPVGGRGSRHWRATDINQTRRRGCGHRAMEVEQEPQRARGHVQGLDRSILGSGLTGYGVVAREPGYEVAPRRPVLLGEADVSRGCHGIAPGADRTLGIGEGAIQLAIHLAEYAKGRVVVPEQHVEAVLLDTSEPVLGCWRPSRQVSSLVGRR